MTLTSPQLGNDTSRPSLLEPISDVTSAPTSTSAVQSERASIELASMLLGHAQAVDSALLFAVFALVSMQASIASVNPLIVASAATLTTVGVARWKGVYTDVAADSSAAHLKKIVAALATCAGLFLLVTYVTNVGHDRSWLPAAMAGAVLVMTAHSSAVNVLRSHRATRDYFAIRLAVIGDAASIAEFDEAEQRDPRWEVTERIEIESYDDVRPLLREVDELSSTSKTSGIDRIVVLGAAAGLPVVNTIVRRCGMRGLGVDIPTGATSVRPSRLELGRVNGFSTVHVRPGLSGRGRLASKRAFDLVVASVVLVLLAPAMVLVGVAIRIGSPGPILYKQPRLGRGGQQFDVIKFRSMVPDADEMMIDLTDLNEADGPLFKMKNDPRITRVGRIIRRTSIDELPQLWNVLCGHMSLVGPRPALPSEADGWPIELFDRLEVAPGITGLWQVSGRSDSSFSEYKRLDLEYVDNWTLALDLAILARTVPALLGRGAY